MTDTKMLPLYDDRPIFSADEIDCKSQLEKSEIMKLFKEGRKALKDDPLKPIYHFASPFGVINDPNGLCFFGGKWHLFYQFMVNNTVYWGHTISDDLIHWKDLPPANYPDEKIRCWSGGTCIDGDRVISMYYGYPEGMFISISTDPMLINWERHTDTPVIKACDVPKSPKDGFTIPDPFLWKEDDTFYALIGGVQAHSVSGGSMRQMYLYSSENLYDWTFVKGFLPEDSFADIFDDGACPYFMPLEERHLIMHYSHRSGSRFILGDYDKATHTFLPINSDCISRDCWFGGVHAPSIFPKDDSMLAIFNINSSQYPVTTDNQMMVLPRKYTICGNHRNQLSVNVIDEVEALRGKHIHLENIDIPENEEISIKEVSGKAMEIIAEFEPKKVPYIEIKVLCSEDNREYTKIQLYPRRSDRVYEDIKKGEYWAQRENYKSTLIIDASHSSLNGEFLIPPPAREDVYLDPEENIKLRIFLDGSVCEVYVNDRATAAIRAYPTLAGSDKVKISSGGACTKLLSLDAWEMNSIY